MKKLIAVLIASLMLVVTCIGFTACGKTLKGFDIDLAKAVADDLGVKVEFQLINWNAKETELSSKNIDLIWNGLTINEGRLEQFSISTPYMNNKQVAVIRKTDANKYTNENTIKSAKVTAEKGSAGEGIAQEKFASTYTGVNAQADALLEVSSGTSDVAIIDSIMAGYYTSSGDFKEKLMVIPDLVFATEQYGIAARKADTGVTDKINTSLAKLYKNGTIRQIATTYGLQNEIVDCGNYVSTGATAGWDYIQSQGKIIIGYTLSFAIVLM